METAQKGDNVVVKTNKKNQTMQVF